MPTNNNQSLKQMKTGGVVGVQVQMPNLEYQICILHERQRKQYYTHIVTLPTFSIECYTEFRRNLCELIIIWHSVFLQFGARTQRVTLTGLVKSSNRNPTLPPSCTFCKIHIHCSDLPYLPSNCLHRSNSLKKLKVQFT